MSRVDLATYETLRGLVGSYVACRPNLGRRGVMSIHEVQGGRVQYGTAMLHTDRTVVLRDVTMHIDRAAAARIRSGRRRKEPCASVVGTVEVVCGALRESAMTGLRYDPYDAERPWFHAGGRRVDDAGLVVCSGWRAWLACSGLCECTS